MAERNYGDSSGGTGLQVEESSRISTSSSFDTAKEELSGSSTEAATISASSLSDPARPDSSEYSSARIQSIMESRSLFETDLEAEIEAPREHWSDLEGEDDGKGLPEANFEVFRRLQSQYREPDGSFMDWRSDKWALGEKIAEGAQGEAFHMKFLRREPSSLNDRIQIIKVFKAGSSLKDLHKQWPQGMLLKIMALKRGFYHDGGCSIGMGMMFNDGRFAFVMQRYWGDLRKVIDLRM